MHSLHAVMALSVSMKAELTAVRHGLHSLAETNESAVVRHRFHAVEALAVLLKGELAVGSHRLHSVMKLAALLKTETAELAESVALRRGVDHVVALEG